MLLEVVQTNEGPISYKKLYPTRQRFDSPDIGEGNERLSKNKRLKIQIKVPLTQKLKMNL